MFQLAAMTPLGEVPVQAVHRALGVAPTCTINACRLSLAKPLEEVSTPTYNIHEAKSQLSRLIDAMQQGETVIIAKAGKPVAVLGPLLTPARRVRGVLKGEIKLGPEFDEPLPAEWLTNFEGQG